MRLACPSLRLGAGEYLVDVAVHARDGSPYDYRKEVFAFTVTARERGVGVYAPEHRWEAAGGVAWRRSGPATDQGDRTGAGGDGGEGDGGEGDSGEGDSGEDDGLAR